MKPKEWLPYYYMEKDEEEKDMYCNRAQVYIDSAFILRPDESELNVLQALLYYARMEVNPYVMGMIYYPKANSELEEAARNNPGNPRIYFLKGKTIINTPEFMGGGKKTALPVLEKALELYREFKPGSDIDPYWGKESAEQLFETCKRDSIR
jgi:tetratricopeptide (TPR) repeat protein